MFTTPINTFLESLSVDEKKKRRRNISISMEVTLLENQNWYYKGHLGRFQYCVDRDGKQLEALSYLS